LTDTVSSLIKLNGNKSNGDGLLSSPICTIW
jgi:hypothetical protein